MSNLIDDFAAKKEAESKFLSLDDRESAIVSSLKEIKVVTKSGFDGEEKDVLRLVCVVETTEGLRDKYFENGTQRFAKELQEKGIQIGSSFTITRNGLQTKTRYELSNVINPAPKTAAPVAAPAAPVAAPAAETVPTPGLEG